jgi:hypothetical protein
MTAISTCHSAALRLKKYLFKKSVLNHKKSRHEGAGFYLT